MLNIAAVGYAGDMLLKQPVPWKGTGLDSTFDACVASGLDFIVCLLTDPGISDGAIQVVQVNQNTTRMLNIGRISLYFTHLEEAREPSGL